MELSRQEYPALLGSLPPNQAVSILNDRVRLIGKVNSDIADWLLERRRVEEAYSQGLRKLASRRQQDAAADLGIFQTPWQSIVSSTESLAQSHGLLASRIEGDVERPLREYQGKNREMQAMTTIQGNLQAMAKESDEAHKKVDKLKAKGGKAAANKVSTASSELESADQQWESQAPFVFEQLQALDESRVNHLRDVLTQFQTHEVDQVERSRVSAESCLNTLLNVNTSDEISTFVAMYSGARPNVPPRRQSKPASTTAPTPLTPARSATASSAIDDVKSERSGAFGSAQKQSPEQKIGGLKRLGTVLGRRKDSSKLSEQSTSPERKSRPSRNPLRRGPSSRDMQQIPSPNTSTSNLPSWSRQQGMVEGRNAKLSESEESQPRPPLPLQPVEVQASAVAPELDLHKSIDPPVTNGNRSTQNIQLSQATVPGGTVSQHDTEGYSIPPLATDNISRAQQEASSDIDQPQFKVDIRSEPIHEENGDAESALSHVANTLRAQAQQNPPQRKLGTARGRRDVRNTVFIPSPQSPENSLVPEANAAPGSPFARGPNQLLEGHKGSDAQSVRSAHSLNSLTKNPISHPEMNGAGLNVSILEIVSASFSQGRVGKAVVMGELALAYNASRNTQNKTTEIIRLENFPTLEKVAPNPTFITQIPDKSGEYNVDLAHISRTAVAFKYQVHLEESNLAIHAPILLSPSWKIEPTQTSVILSYSFNPVFASTKRSVSLHNVHIVIHLENARAVSCQSKPVGNFSKERSLIYWKLGDLELDSYAEAPKRLLARFSTDSEAKPGTIDARWEIDGDNAAGIGSGLSLSQMKTTQEDGTDPFADEGTSANTRANFQEVPLTRKLISGKYNATPDLQT